MKMTGVAWKSAVILAMQNNLTVTTLKMLGDISKAFLKSHDVAIWFW